MAILLLHKLYVSSPTIPHVLTFPPLILENVKCHNGNLQLAFAPSLVVILCHLLLPAYGDVRSTIRRARSTMILVDNLRYSGLLT